MLVQKLVILLEEYQVALHLQHAVTLGIKLYEQTLKCQLKNCLSNQNQNSNAQVTKSMPIKVWTFWEGHNIWKNLSLKIWRYSVVSNFKWKTFSNFVFFSNVQTLLLSPLAFCWLIEQLNALSWILPCWHAYFVRELL